MKINTDLTKRKQCQKKAHDEPSLVTWQGLFNIPCCKLFPELGMRLGKDYN